MTPLETLTAILPEPERAGVLAAMAGAVPDATFATFLGHLRLLLVATRTGREVAGFLVMTVATYDEAQALAGVIAGSLERAFSASSAADDLLRRVSQH